MFRLKLYVRVIHINLSGIKTTHIITTVDLHSYLQKRVVVSVDIPLLYVFPISLITHVVKKQRECARIVFGALLNLVASWLLLSRGRGQYVSL